MGRSGSREGSLREHLAAAGLADPHLQRPASARLASLTPELRASILEMFAELGGADEKAFARTGPRGWDIVLADGTILELDEEQHFTPYRELTLESSWSRDLPWASAYRGHVADHAAASASNAQHWTKKVPEQMFGPPGHVGDYTGPGSPRGKQRALFDAIRDATAAAGIVRLARVAVHDTISGVPLGAALSGRGHLDIDALVALIRVRTTSL